MSILLKYWDIPPRCVECPCVSIGGTKCMSDPGYEVYTCKAIDKKLDNINVMYERDKGCPFIEVPNTYEIKTRSLTDEERKSYLEALKKGSVKTGNRLYSDDKGGERI